MSRALALCLVVGIIVTGLSANANAVPLLLQHQGRLLDGLGQPMDGVIPIKFSLFDSSADGVELWSETHASVTVTSGLFSVVLGSITPLSADLFASPPSSGVPQPDLYLEIEVNGDVVSPRSQITSTPYAAVAVRVDGDLQTSPGALSIDYHDVDDDGDGLALTDTEDSATVYMTKFDASGAGNVLQFKVYQPGQPSYGNILFENQTPGQPSDTGFELSVRADVRVEKFNVKQEFGPTQGSHSSRQGATDSSGFVDVSSANGSDSSSVISEAKVSRSRLKTYFETGSIPTETQFSSQADSATLHLRYGTDQSVVEGKVLPHSSAVAIKSKGTGADPNRSSGVSSETDDTTAASENYVDLDGDGHPECKASLSAQVSDADNAASCGFEFGVDANNDGNPEASSSMLVTLDSLLEKLDLDADNDSFVDRYVRVRVTPSDGTSILQGTTVTGLDKLTTTSEIVTDTAGVSCRMSANIGINESIPDVTLNTSVTTQEMSRVAIRDVDKDGFPDVLISEKVDSSRASHTFIWDSRSELGRSHQIDVSADSAGAGMLSAIDLDGDGLEDVLITEACTADSAYWETSFSYPNAQTPLETSGASSKSTRKHWLCSNFRLGPSSKTETTVTCDSVSAGSSWTADDFTGSLVSLTIQASTDGAVNPIEHSSGAHLTPGGVWTNASDKNLKENFQPVDGAALLEQIDSLDISEWNYKAESDDVRHIGPTAQDFRKTFGVGSDGKSISTIDPAGIALAAIKALNEKSKRIDQLETEVSELKKLVENLVQKQNQ